MNRELADPVNTPENVCNPGGCGWRRTYPRLDAVLTGSKRTCDCALRVLYAIAIHASVNEFSKAPLTHQVVGAQPSLLFGAHSTFFSAVISGFSKRLQVPYEC